MKNEGRHYGDNDLELSPTKGKIIDLKMNKETLKILPRSLPIIASESINIIDVKESSVKIITLQI